MDKELMELQRPQEEVEHHQSEAQRLREELEEWEERQPPFWKQLANFAVRIFAGFTLGVTLLHWSTWGGVALGVGLAWLLA